jgi:hypothetical protein
MEPGLTASLTVLVRAVGVVATPFTLTVISGYVACPYAMGPFIVTITCVGVSADTSAEAIAKFTKFVADNAVWLIITPPTPAKLCAAFVLLVYATLTTCPAEIEGMVILTVVDNPGIGLAAVVHTSAIEVGVTVLPATTMVKSAIVALPDVIAVFIVTTSVVGAVLSTLADAM